MESYTSVNPIRAICLVFNQFKICHWTVFLYISIVWMIFWQKKLFIKCLLFLYPAWSNLVLITVLKFIKGAGISRLNWVKLVEGRGEGGGGGGIACPTFMCIYLCNRWYPRGPETKGYFFLQMITNKQRFKSIHFMYKVGHGVWGKKGIIAIEFQSQ